jgi:hypothetical protein
MNLFADCDTIEEVIGQAVGAGSVCWESLDQAGEFQSTRAAYVADNATERVRELILGRNIHLPETEE